MILTRSQKAKNDYSHGFAVGYKQGLKDAPSEAKKCDTCRHEKSQWFNRCADCFDYELWEENRG